MLQFRLLLVKVRQACFESHQTSIKAVLTTCGVAWVWSLNKFRRGIERLMGSLGVGSKGSVYEMWCEDSLYG